MDASKQAEGRTLLRGAYSQAPSWSRGINEKDASHDGRRMAMEPDRFREATGRAHLFARRVRPCTLIDARLQRRATAIHREGPLPQGSSTPASAGRLYRS